MKTAKKKSRKQPNLIGKNSNLSPKTIPLSLIKLALQPSETGFLMPIVIMIGLLLLGLSTTMMITSQGDTLSSTSQKYTAQGLAITEGGINRTIAKLNSKYHNYLRYTYDPNAQLGDTAVDEWSTPPAEAPVCLAPETFPTELMSGNIGSGNYELLAYRYDAASETGTLLIQGKEAPDKAVARLQISTTIFDKILGGTFPGLYAIDFMNMANNKVLATIGDTGESANVICGDCPLINPATDCENGEPTQQALLDAIGSNNADFIQGEIVLTPLVLPTIPEQPTADCSVSNPPCTNIIASVITGTKTFPFASHKATEGIYYYQMAGIDMSGSAIKNTVTFGPPSTTANYKGTSYRVYVTGNINMGGQSELVNTIGNPGDLVIFGKLDDGDDTYDQIFTLNGGSQGLKMFIYAPDAKITVNGGSADPDLSGAVWARVWDGSSSTNVEIRVPDDMPDFLETSLGEEYVIGVSQNKTTPITSWEQKEAN